MSLKAEYLVIDSGGFLKNVPLRELGDNLITLPEVIEEIRDKETRRRLEVLPYDLEFKQPSTEAIQKITEFSKKTGDYASLSAVDIRVLAVAYDLEVEKVGLKNLRTEPVVKRTVEFYHPKERKEASNLADSKLPGFFNGDITDSVEKKTENFNQFNYWREPLPELNEDLVISEEENCTDTNENESSQFELSTENVQSLDNFLLANPFFDGFEISCVDFAIHNLIKHVTVDQNLHPNLYRWTNNVSSYEVIDFSNVDAVQVLEPILGNEESNSSDQGDDFDIISTDIGYSSDKENEDEQCSDSDEEGWITPGNIKSKKDKLNQCDGYTEPQKVEVACVTTDFAMQNVCKHLGLNIIGTDGRLIKETKNWILRCYGCFKLTPDMTKKFCPKCGNKTLKRVSVTVDANGAQQIHISTRKPLSCRGKKFSLPAPKGGKHAINPKLVEDQREPQQRLSKKALQKNNPLGDDFTAGTSPFVIKDVTSKSAMLGLHGRGKGNAQIPGAYWSRKNPNAVKKNTGNRKK